MSLNIMSLWNLVLCLMLFCSYLFTKLEATRCENVHGICKNHQNVTMMPNLAGHKTAVDAELVANQYAPLIKTNCSPQLREFVCSYFFPPCANVHLIVPPCQERCVQSQDGCKPLMEMFGFQFPDYLRCDLFPVCSRPDKTGAGSAILSKNITNMLKCDEGTVVEVDKVKHLAKTKCCVWETKHKLAEICDGKQYCMLSLELLGTIFGTHCPQGLGKVQVKYNCVKKTC